MCESGSFDEMMSAVGFSIYHSLRGQGSATNSRDHASLRSINKATRAACNSYTTHMDFKLPRRGQDSAPNGCKTSLKQPASAGVNTAGPQVSIQQQNNIEQEHVAKFLQSLVCLQALRIVDQGREVARLLEHGIIPRSIKCLQVAMTG